MRAWGDFRYSPWLPCCFWAGLETLNSAGQWTLRARVEKPWTNQRKRWKMPIKTIEDEGRNNKNGYMRWSEDIHICATWVWKSLKMTTLLYWVLQVRWKINQACRTCPYKFMVSEVHSERRYGKWINKAGLSGPSCPEWAAMWTRLYTDSQKSGSARLPRWKQNCLPYHFQFSPVNRLYLSTTTSERSKTLCSICAILCQHSASSLAKTQITPLIRSSPRLPTVPSPCFQDLVKCEHICVHTPLYLLSQRSYAQQAPIFPVNAFPNIPIKITSRNTLLAARPMSAFISLSGWVYIWSRLCSNEISL